MEDKRYYVTLADGRKAGPADRACLIRWSRNNIINAESELTDENGGKAELEKVLGSKAAQGSYMSRASGRFIKSSPVKKNNLGCLKVWIVIVMICVALGAIVASSNIEEPRDISSMPFTEIEKAYKNSDAKYSTVTTPAGETEVFNFNRLDRRICAVRDGKLLAMRVVYYEDVLDKDQAIEKLEIEKEETAKETKNGSSILITDFNSRTPLVRLYMKGEHCKGALVIFDRDTQEDDLAYIKFKKVFAKQFPNNIGVLIDFWEDRPDKALALTELNITPGESAVEKDDKGDIFFANVSSDIPFLKLMMRDGECYQSYTAYKNNIPKIYLEYLKKQ